MKPKIELLKDEYAINTGKHWVCMFGGICARGDTPSNAYSELMDHFKKVRESKRPIATQIRAF